MSIKKRKAPYVPLTADALGHIAKTPGFKSRVKGSFKKECDINTIVGRFSQANGGALPGPLPRTPGAEVSDATWTAMSLADRINFVRDQKRVFNSFPKAFRDAVKSPAALASMPLDKVRDLIKSLEPAPEPAPSPSPPPAPAS